MEEGDNHRIKSGDKEMEQKVILKRCTCERCDYTWLPRSEETPLCCPKCKSPYWNRPRKNKSPEKEKAQ